MAESIDLLQCVESHTDGNMGETRVSIARGVSILSNERGAHCMTMTSHSSRGMCAVVGVSLILAGCDYWPPALQAQIEQMRLETQTLAIEKAQLEGQISDLSKTRQEFQSQVDELSRMNREKSAMIMSLQQQLDRARAKSMKSIASKTSPRKTSARSTAKSASQTPKRTLKTPPTKQSVSKGVGAR